MIAKKKINPSVVTYKKQTFSIVSKIKANNIDEALSYFKGRFNVVGTLVKANTKTTFTIKGKVK